MRTKKKISKARNAPIRLCVIAVGASPILQLEAICRSWERSRRPNPVALRAHYVGSDSLREQDWPRILNDIYEADFVILDTMGVAAGFDQALVETIVDYAGPVAVVNATSVAVRALTRLGAFSLSLLHRMGKPGAAPDPARMMKMAERMERMGRALPVGPLRDMRNYFWISRYWLHGSRDNLDNMLRLICREYFNHDDIPKPRPPRAIRDCSILVPGTGDIFTTPAEFHTAYPPDPGKPGLGLLFRSRAYPLDTHPVMSCLMARLSSSFNVVPIALDSTISRDFKTLRSLLMPGGTPVVDVLINPEAFRLSQGPVGGDAGLGIAFLRELDVPLLHPCILTKRTLAQWRDDQQGAGSAEFLISIFLPELDGAIEMYPIAAVGSNHGAVPELAPIPERIEHLCDRAAGWAKLRRTPNSDKRIALILYNYPPDESSIGSSAFFDTFASAAAVLQKLSDAGYTTTPITAEELRDSLIACARMCRTADTAGLRIDAAAYRRLTRNLPGSDMIEKRWGAFPGNVMSDRRTVAVPGILRGNVFIGLQPPRTDEGHQSRDYHDKNLPPHHQYAAFYRWLQEDFKAHAVVHLGTHGTLEFLPGKEKALSDACFPDALLGRMPHIYVYYCGNPSEAMIARRRSHALLISHLGPPFTPSGLYDELLLLEQRCAEYAEARHLNPGTCPAILEDIERLARQLGWEESDPEALHSRLHEMKTALVPARLHTLGSGYAESETLDCLCQVLRFDTAAGVSLHKLLADRRGWNWDALTAQPLKLAEHLRVIEHDARQWIASHLNGSVRTTEDPQEAALAERTAALAKALLHNRELDQLLRALSGGYIEPGQAGDLHRCADVLPTGRNLVQFDPRAVPTPAALRTGAEIARRTLEQYAAQHGRYPRSTATVLWGLETSQTQGETVGQILAYAGVRVTAVAGQWEPRLELIPLAELGRPRIDVAIQICGFFRDMFPNVLNLLHEALALAASADEPDEMNHIRAHARRLFTELREAGMQETEARDFALARVFGPAAAEYGTSIERTVERRAWRDEAELAAAYCESLKHVYTPGCHGMEMESLLQRLLSRVEVVSQVRSTRDYEVTDLDHYYAFFGGLAKSVEQASGKKAAMFIADALEGSVRTETVQDAIARGLATRVLNPRWLDAMLGHSHHGGHEIAKRLENMIGLAATTGAVAPAAFEQVTRRLVFDETMRNRIERNNPYALRAILERLCEAQARGYWSPDDQTLDRLRQLYLSAETHVEELQQ